MNYHKISPDGVYYAEIGEYLYQHHQYGTRIPEYPAIVQPPVYPVLIALFRNVFPRTLAGKMVSIFAGSLLVLVVYGIARRMFSDSTGKWAAFVLSIHPFFIEYSAKFLTEMTFLLWVGLGAYFWIRFWQERRGLWIVLAAVGFVLAYLTRIEGLAVWIVMGIWLLLQTVRRRNSPIHLMLFLGILTIAFWGYSSWASRHMGERVWIPKFKLIEAHRKLYQLYLRTDPDFAGKSFTQREQQMMYSLSADKSRLAAHDYFYTKRLPVPDENQQTETSARSGLKKWVSFVKLTIYNSLKAARIFLIRNTLPFLMIGFFLLGVVLSFRRRLNLANALLLSLFIAFGYFLLSHVERRFLLGWSLVFLFWMAYGIDQFHQLWRERIRHRFQNTLPALVALIFLLMMPYHVRTFSKMLYENYIYRFTQDIRREIPAGSRVVTSRAMVAFYNDYVFYRLPFAPLEDLREFMTLNRIQYFILEHPRDVRFMPHLKRLLDPKTVRLLNLDRIYQKSFDRQTFLVFQVQSQQS
ncbi:MAG: glycosyltransferase family 39 protein [Calditrichaeota bacterium]|nr:glycosyltransferase family 39 protein [Calditrichota bacterium]